ncbi:hypothetical protein DIE18_32320 [Burkholderia sp. Bp9125]|nr:hypothetical protein DIE18_32320 [Burkholderia sp. Bp9125]
MPVMKRGRSWVLGMLAAQCCTGALAAGVLKLSRTEMTIAPDKAAPELWAENVGDTPLYLNVEQHLVENPGETPEHLVAVSDVRHPGLLILPNRLTLSPGQKYRMVVKELRTPAQSQVWRLTFRPAERIVVETARPEETSAPLFISVGYGVVIYQLHGDQSP